MSKFFDLCSVWDETVERNTEYEKACHQFAKDLIQAFQNYFDVPEGRLNVMPLSPDERKPNTRYSIQAAMKKDSIYDPWFHFLMVLTMKNTPANPRNFELAPYIATAIFIRKDGDIFSVKNGVNGETNQVEQGDHEGIARLCENLFNSLMEYASTDFIYQENDPQRSIGFKTL